MNKVKSFFKAINPFYGHFENWLDIFRKPGSENGEGVGTSVWDTISNGISNWWKYSTHSGLTQQQIEENQLMRENRRMQSSDEVEGMNAAGLNPGLMYQGAPSTSGNAAPSASAGSLSDLLQLAMLPAQISNLNANTDRTRADAAKARSETDLNTQLRLFNEEINPLRKEAQEVSNSLGRATEKKINAEVDKIAEEMHRIAAETETEATKQLYNIAAAGLADAQAESAIALLPYSIELSKAQTAEKKALARLYGLQAMYQKRIINDGFLDALISTQESNAEMLKVKERIKSGKAFTIDDDSWLAKTWNFFAEASGLSKGVQVIDYVLDKVNVIAPIVGKQKSDISGAHDPFGYMNE